MRSGITNKYKRTSYEFSVFSAFRMLSYANQDYQETAFNQAFLFGYFKPR
jgi:hypothetical protein